MSDKINQTGTSESAPQPKKKRFTWWKIALGIFALVIALFVLKVVLILTAKPTISVDYVAEWNRISKPLDYDPNQNAALDYRKAIAVYANMPPKFRLGLRKWPGDMDETELNLLSEWLDANREALGHIKRGSTKPYLWAKGSAGGNSLWDYTPSIVFTRVYEFGRLLTRHAKLEAANGRFESAFQDIAAVYRLGRHLAGGRITMHQAAATSLRAHTVDQTFIILANERLDAETLKDLERQLRCEISQNPQLDFQFEKFLGLDTIQRMYTDDGTGNGRLVPTELTKALVSALLASRQPGLAQRVLPIVFRKSTDSFPNYEQPSELAVYIRLIYMALVGPDKKEAVQAVEKYLNCIDQLKSRSLWQLHSISIDSDEEIYNHVKSSFIKGMSPRVYSLIRRHQEQRAGQSALLATIAVLRYKAEKGQLPENLQQLVSTGYLKELPMDPYSDGPLVYRRTGDDFILYSVGRDFKDDRGVVGTFAFPRPTWYVPPFPP